MDVVGLVNVFPRRPDGQVFDEGEGAVGGGQPRVSRNNSTIDSGLELELNPEVRVEPVVDNVPIIDSERVASLRLVLAVAGGRDRGVEDDLRNICPLEILGRAKHAAVC